jgi:rubrerythrin
VKGVHVLDEAHRTTADPGVVLFLRAGERAQGPFQCADCGYGVSVQTALPSCPMCAGTSWEPVLHLAPLEAAERLPPPV